MTFHVNCSARQIHMKPYFLLKKKSKLSSAVVVIGAIRVKERKRSMSSKLHLFPKYSSFL